MRTAEREREEVHGPPRERTIPDGLIALRMSLLECIIDLLELQPIDWFTVVFVTKRGVGAHQY